MLNAIRVAAVAVGGALAAASATAPKTHVTTRSASIAADFDTTWTALIDLFGERNWAIASISKESGIITTDWHRLDAMGDVYADCGGTGLWTVQSTDIRFNVRVKAAGAAAEVSVGPSFRQVRSFDGAVRSFDCSSRGTVESWIHNEVALRAGPSQVALSAPANPTNDPKLAVAYWCSSRDGVCSADKRACGGLCHELAEVWCARYVEQGRHRFLCSSTRSACLSLRETPQHRRGRSDFGECVEQRASGQTVARPAAQASAATPVAPVPVARGYFCATSVASSTAGFCMRDKADCQRVRDSAVVAVTDLGQCRIEEAAFCHAVGSGERCAPSQDVCEHQAKSAGATCVERR